MSHPVLSRSTSALAVVVLILMATNPASLRARQSLTVSPADLLTYYWLGEHDAVSRSLHDANRGNLIVVIDGIREHASSWIDADGPDWADRRRLVAASVALELALAGLDTQWTNSRIGLEWACELLRAHDPEPGERTWHLAAIALFEGARDAGGLRRHLDHVRSRFPAEPRVLLAEAFLREFDYLDEITYLGIDHGPGGELSAYDDAVDVAASANEAHLRRGFLRLQARRFDEAVADFRRIGEPDDPGQLYLARLFEGWAHQRRDRREEAVAAFRDAAGALPGAYTGALVLALELYATGQRDEADRLMEATMTTDPAVSDPWQTYGYGDLRRIDSLIESLRRTLS